MANDFYTSSNVPTTGAFGDSSVIRNQFSLLEAAFNKMPSLAVASLPIFVNASGTALEALSAVNARTALGLVIGTNVQAFDATLLSIAALGTAADKIAYTTGVDTWAETPLTDFARTLIDDATEVIARQTLLLDKHGADIASAATINLDTSTGDLIDITGTTTITAITLAEGLEKTVRFTGILTLTNGASLVLPGAANIPTAAGDFAEFRGYAAGVVRCVKYNKASGKSVTPSFRKNRIHNGGFAVDQRVNSATSRADDTYGIDCGYTLTQTGAIQVTQQTLQEDGQPFNIRLTQNQAAAQRMGWAQIVEARDSRQDRNKAMVLSARVRISNSQALRYAILEWTGTADLVTSDVVLDWTSGVYTPNNFFLAANLVVTAVGSITPAAATWTQLTDLTGVLGASVNNQIVFIWTEGTAAQNVTLDIGLVQLEPGTVATEFEYRPFEQELALAMRYYEKSFVYLTAPAQNVGSVTGAFIGSLIVAGAVATVVGSITYQIKKRSLPSVIFYNPLAANAFARNQTLATDAIITTTVNNESENGTGIDITGLAAWAVNNRIVVHWDSTASL